MASENDVEIMQGIYDCPILDRASNEYTKLFLFYQHQSECSPPSSILVLEQGLARLGPSLACAESKIQMALFEGASLTKPCASFTMCWYGVLCAGG